MPYNEAIFEWLKKYAGYDNGFDDLRELPSPEEPETEEGGSSNADPLYKIYAERYDGEIAD